MNGREKDLHQEREPTSSSRMAEVCENSARPQEPPPLCLCISPRKHLLNLYCEASRLEGLTPIKVEKDSDLNSLTGHFSLAITDGGSSLAEKVNPILVVFLLRGDIPGASLDRGLMADDFEEVWGFQKAFMFLCSHFIRISADPGGQIDDRNLTKLRREIRNALDLPPYREVNFYNRFTDEMLHSVVESSQAPLIVLDAQDRVFFANFVAQAILQRSTQFLEGIQMADLLATEEDLFLFHDLRERLCQKMGDSAELRMRTMDGTEFDALMVGNRVFNKLMPESHISFTFHDITARKQAERSESELRKRLTELLHVTNELGQTDSLEELGRKAVTLGRERLGFDRIGIFLTTEEPNILQGLFGTDEEGHLRDERHSRLVLAEWQIGILNNDDPTKAILYRDTDIRNEAQGTVGTGSAASAVLWDGRKAAGYIFTDNLVQKRPLTESDCELLSLYASVLGNLVVRRRSEEERRKLERSLLEAQKLESLGVLAGGVAHDFNNLLVGILGNASLALMETPKDSPNRETMESVIEAAERAAELTNQMLAYSGKGRFLVQEVDLSSLVHEFIPLLRSTIPKKAALHCDLAPDLPPIEADTTQIKQLLMNLLTNASEAIGEIPGVITISTGTALCTRKDLESPYTDPDLPEGKYVFLEVSDTGQGIEDSILPRIFDPFFSTKFSGRGLGLPAALGIVRGHRGLIQVQSREEDGASFRVLFPALQITKKSANEDTTGPETIPSMQPWILVIEDEESVRRFVHRVLKKNGFGIVEACDGMDGIAEYVKDPNRFQAILLDLTMPRMNGEEVFREIRSLNPDLPIIFSSGYSLEESSRQVVLDDRSLFIQKPYRSQKLVETLQQALSMVH